MRDIQQEILDSIIKHKKFNDLGTEINTENVEIYSNTKLNGNLKGKEKENRFRQIAVENPYAPQAAPYSLPSGPAAASEKYQEDQLTSLGFSPVMAARPEKGYERLSTNDNYIEINVQINQIRLEGRYKRVKVYISLKRDFDQKYSIFLAGSATDSMHELSKGAKKKRDVVLDTIATLKNDHPNALIARLHYKAPRGVKTSNFHRQLLTHSMIALYEENGIWYSELFLLGDYIDIPLDNALSEKQKQSYYASGIYRKEMEEFDGDDELQ